MRRLAVILLTLPLSGCFFVYLPTGAIVDSLTGEHGKFCVAETVREGDVLRLPAGGTGTIMKLEGKSRRCREPMRPIRAEIQPN